jgi:hypothetical protein
MAPGRMIKVTSPSSEEGGGETVLYVVGTEDPEEALRLVRREIGIGNKMEDVGRVSEHLLASLKTLPGKVTRL